MKPKVYLTNKESGERYLIVSVDKSQDKIVLQNVETGSEFVSHLSKINQNLYSIETEESVVESETVVAEESTPTEVHQEPITEQIVAATKPKMTRKEVKVIIDAMKAEARPWLSRLAEMEAEMLELNGGMGEAKKLALAVSRLQNWVDS